MISDERRKKILELLEQQHYMSVEKLARAIFVSEPTIRRDLAQLSKEGSLKRTRGGASFVNPDTVDWPFSFRKKENIDEKRKIAQLAIKLIHDGDSVFLDSGSTCFCLAREMVELKHLSVLTYGVDNAKILAANDTINSQITCGSYQLQRTSIYGFGTVDYIRKFHAKYAFISSPGFHPEKGIFNYDHNEAELKTAFYENADYTIVLLDYKKIGKSFPYLELANDHIDVIITDRPFKKHIQDLCDVHNIKVIHTLEQMRSYILEKGL
ncbi:DeoR/GlpR family DNA-binding transcription regulator [Amedibacillus sp. YH-ame6]